MSDARAETGLSMDARVLVSSFFSWGEKTIVTIGGLDAESVLSDRAAAAMRELVEAGYVTVEAANDRGRMRYTGTDKCADARLSFKAMKEHGQWSATKPNPARSA